MKKFTSLMLLFAATMLLVVSCSKTDDPVLIPEIELSESSLSLSAEEATFTLGVYTTVDWSVELPEGVDWITVDQMSGSGNSILNFSITNNTIEEIRETTIAITSNEASTKEVTITQAARGKDDPIVFADAAFKQSLLDRGIDLNEDYEISYFEAESVTNLNIGVTETTIDFFTSIDGIQYFTNLEIFLCTGFDITEVDLSNQPNMTSLTLNGLFDEIDVTNMPLLWSLKITSSNITTIDLSNNPELTILQLLQSPISEVDLSSQSKMELLSLGYGELSTLDISNMADLTYISVSYSGNLKSLDVSNNPKLTSIMANDCQLTGLNTSNNPDLLYLTVWNNEITSLDLTNNLSLETLGCYNNRISALDISHLPRLGIGDVMGWTGIYSNLFLNCGAQKDESGSDMDMTLSIAQSQLDNNILDTTTEYNTNIILNIIDDVPGGGDEPEPDPNDIVFEDAAFKAALIDAGVDTDSDGEISYSEAEVVTSLQLSEMGISSLAELEYFTALLNLACYGNKITQLDISKNTELNTLNCYENELTSLDLSNNPNMSSLSCHANHISELDVTGLSLLGNGSKLGLGNIFYNFFFNCGMQTDTNGSDLNITVAINQSQIDNGIFNADSGFNTNVTLDIK